MIYTLTHGVDNQFRQRLAQIVSLSLPVIAVLFLVLAALSFNTHQSAGQNPYISVKKPASLSAGLNQPKAASSGGGSGNSTAGSSSGTMQPAMSLTNLGTPAGSSVPTPSTSTTPVTGGMGGGGITGGDTSTGTGGTSTSTGTGDTGVSGGTSGTSGDLCVDLLGKQILCATLDP